MYMRAKYVLSYFFYLKYYNLYFNTFFIRKYPIISLYLPVFSFIKSFLSYLTFVLLSLS